MRILLSLLSLTLGILILGAGFRSGLSPFSIAFGLLMLVGGIFSIISPKISTIIYGILLFLSLPLIFLNVILFAFVFILFALLFMFSILSNNKKAKKKA
ncbi:hypothetical protein [Bacillus subtilis]|uniref:hypothetical protein n=1 Tax=Bacillus subtilis TaxID=1423 RepID=UPI00081C634C|nr:hypothetical protein [Bacillus subtilis]AOA54485.1 hypothetical protein BSHJ0_01913 [Bacillus subtilis]QHM16547.1 hypothetical protein C7M30_00166 [Bacillus subtilis]RXM08329.1 hypothetical protein ETL41_00660 [Bacillus subtilis]UVV91304.1 hypothetical protein NX810_09810 [Bacillus subtilis]